MKVRAVTYAYTASRDDSAQLQRQQEACRQYAADHGLEIWHEFTDVGGSGRSVDRQGLQELVHYLRNGHEARALIVLDRGRLSRRMDDYMALLKLLSELGVTIHDITTPVQDPDGLLRVLEQACREYYGGDAEASRGSNA